MAQAGCRQVLGSPTSLAWIATLVPPLGCRGGPAFLMHPCPGLCLPRGLEALGTAPVRPRPLGLLATSCPSASFPLASVLLDAQAHSPALQPRSPGPTGLQAGQRGRKWRRLTSLHSGFGGIVTDPALGPA